jgi:signal transduction histidine kinase
MNRVKIIWKKIALPLLFASSVFLVMVFSMLLIFTVTFLLSRIGLINSFEQNRFPLFQFSVVSIAVGTVIAAIFSRLPLRPLREIMDASDKIANGDYSVRLDLKGPEEFQNLSRKFNHMAEELGSVEMLRTDFVNNFSHEFKTPIVSIRGFAKMLKWDDVTPEERNEYLDIIIDESERLAELSTNVLNLSKIEQQTILTGQNRFNVSEQIRLVIAMMESKWRQKRIDITFDCGEIFIYGNEEMLKQVWINLLDNAVKFSPDGGKLKIEIQHTGNHILVSFSNQGKAISDEAAAHIFDKFYQADTSHTTKGNGLGLAIAKRIVELHGGEIYLRSSQYDVVTFFVKVPLR